jgi:hypothetical protein
VKASSLELTCRAGDDLHHDSVNLLMTKLELLEELERKLFRFLENKQIGADVIDFLFRRKKSEKILAL